MAAQEFIPMLRYLWPENAVKNVLENNFAFLRENFKVDNQVAAKLYGWKPQLLADPPYHEIRQLNERGSHYDAFEKWHMFAKSSYTEDSLKEFCKCLREIGEKGAKHKLVKVAEEILKKFEAEKEKPSDTPTSKKKSILNNHSWQITCSIVSCFLAVCFGILFALLPAHENKDNFRAKLEDFCLKSSILAGDDLFFKFGRTKMSYSPITVLNRTGRSMFDVQGACEGVADSDLYLNEFSDDFSAILDIPPTDGRRRILVEGEFGAGKSTLARKLCHEYTAGTFAQDYELVVKVELSRGPILTLTDLVATSIGRSDLVDEIVSFINKSNGAGVLFLFDAFDEFSHINHKNSIIMDIFKGRIAPKSSYLLTSRPSAASSLLPYVDLHIFLCGYTKVQVELYINSYFKHSDIPERGDELLNTLSNNFRLSRMCSSPLLLLMICNIANTADTELQTHLAEGDVTFTEIFNLTLLSVASRYMDKDEGTKSTLFYPDHYIRATDFRKLTKLALTGIQNEKQFFSITDVDFIEKVDLGCALTDLKHLGVLVNITASGQVGGTVSVYHFILYSFQELFAAYEVASWQPTDQEQFWTMNLVMDHDKWRLYNLVGRGYEMVFLFFCGLTGLKTESIQHLLLQAIEPDMGLRVSLNNPMIEMCFHLHESQNTHFVRKVMNRFGNELEIEKSMYYNKKHHRTTVWCLSHHMSLTGLKFSSWTAAEVAGVLSDFDAKRTFRNVTSLDWDVSGDSKGLSEVYSFFEDRQLETLNLNLADSTEFEPQQIIINLVASNTFSLTNVVIVGGSKHTLCLDSVIPDLRTCRGLRSLTLESVSVSHHHLQDLLMSLSSITKLELYKVEVESDLSPDVVGTELQRAIATSKELTHVCIRGYISEVLERAAVLALVDVVQLQHLQLGLPVFGNFPREEVMLPTVRSLQNGKIRVLHISGLMLSDDPVYEAFFSNLWHSPISKLSLEFGVTETLSSGNGVVLTAFRNGIQNCTSLKSLSLGGFVPMKMWELPADVTRHVISTIALCRGLDQIELKRSAFNLDLVKRLSVFVGDSSVRSVKLVNVMGLSAQSIAIFLINSLESMFLEEIYIYSSEMYSQDNQDLVDKDLLNQLRRVISGTTSLKHLTVHCAHLKWTNVARSLMEGAADSDSLRTLDIIVNPPPDNVTKVKHLSGLTVKVASRDPKVMMV